MKKILKILFFIVIVFIFFFSCNNAGKNKKESTIFYKNPDIEKMDKNTPYVEHLISALRQGKITKEEIINQYLGKYVVYKLYIYNTNEIDNIHELKKALLGQTNVIITRKECKDEYTNYIIPKFSVSIYTNLYKRDDYEEGDIDRTMEFTSLASDVGYKRNRKCLLYLDFSSSNRYSGYSYEIEDKNILCDPIGGGGVLRFYKKYKKVQGTKTFRGTINSKYKIEMEWKNIKNKIIGQYYYLKIKKPIKIEGKIIKKKGALNKIRIYEFDKTGKKVAVFDGEEVSLEDYKGIWKTLDNKRQYPFEIKNINFYRFPFISSKSNKNITITNQEITPEMGSKLIGSWATLEGADVEEILFEKDGGENYYASFLHERPAYDGTWEISNKKLILIVRSGEEKIIYNRIILTNDVLHLFTPKGEEEIYKKIKKEFD